MNVPTSFRSATALIQRHGIRFASYNALQKKTLKRYLFEYQIPLSYSKVIETVTACRDDLVLPKKVTSANLMGLKKVLETYRKRTGNVIPENVLIERNLVERAAELGDATGIAVLCGDTLTDPATTNEDKAHAEKLLIELMNKRFPLSFKVSGDLSYGLGMKDAALKLYRRALEEGLSETSTKTECLRNIGLLLFSQGNALEARSYFLRAVEMSDSNDQVADCHFYLGQMYENDKERVRYHFERAAMSSLKEAFAPLGFLLLNYFNEPALAYEWFTQGALLGDGLSLVGLLDCSMNKNDIVKAQGYILKISQRADGPSLLASRQKTVHKLKLIQEKNFKPLLVESAEDKTENSPSVSDRWGI